MKIKQIVSGAAISLLALSFATAYEATAKVTMEGSIVKESKTKGSDASYDIFALDAVEDHSKNGLEIDVDGGLAGAHFELFFELEGSSKAEDGWNASARNTYIWFKPLDELNVRLGYVGRNDFFIERVDEEKVGNPFALSSRGSAVPSYITNADTDEMGFSLAYSPLEELTISAAIAPGIGSSGITKQGSNDIEYAAWGLTASYDFSPFRFEASYRDNGKDSWKVIRFGAGYESENLYAFIQPVFGIDYIASKDKYEMNGSCIDLYCEYTIDALKLTAHLPVTIRTTGKDSDPNYLEFLVKGAYNLGSYGLADEVCPYLLVKNMDENAVTLDDNLSDSLALTLQGGTSLKIGEVNLDTGVCVDIHSKDDTSERVTWSVPFSASIEF
ncbi:porin [Treponema sp.]|uniref:porin n=1 Tax=Treponema sp. TaxID=166 RepID=UPI0025DFFFA0|nr:porin [Treponema sp.]MCR5217701.1 porin [Treponema sp.]